MKKRLLAMLLAGTMVVSLCACGGSQTADPTTAPTPTTAASAGGDTQTTPDPTATPTPVPVETLTFKEAPMLTEQVNAGTLPKVEDRLPVKEDVFVEQASYLTIGNYGGELKRILNGKAGWGTGKLVEEGLFRFTAEATVEPNVAKGYDVNADATVYTIYLREGMKWSDGEDFTADDCVFFYNSMCLKETFGKSLMACWKDADGNPATVEKVDDYTFTVKFAAGKVDFIERVAVDAKWTFAPEHYHHDLMAEFVGEETAMANAAARGFGFSDLKSLGKETQYYFWNYAGIPTLNSFVLSTEAGKNDVTGDYFEYVRNPYYWKVDAEGNQLPYIDKITYTRISDVSQGIMLLLDGSNDFATVAMEDITTILESDTKINIYEWSATDWGDTRTQLQFNLSVADEKLNALFNNKDFRQAMSICVDRNEVANLLSDGWQKGGQAAPQPGSLGYSEEWANKWTEYDVASAKKLFESAGLVMGSDGFYDFADGTDFVLNIVSVADSGAATSYEVLETYWRAAGIKCTFRDYDRSYIDTKMQENGLECVLLPVTAAGDLSIILKPNSMVPGTATNVVWYGNMTEATATGDLLKLIQLNNKLAKTADTEERNEIALEMLKLHEENMWVLNYMESSKTYHAVNARIKNFLPVAAWSDILRDLGIAHVQCWYIEE